MREFSKDYYVVAIDQRGYGVGIAARVFRRVLRNNDNEVE